MSTALTSQGLQMAKLTSNSWPNVTLPNFDIRFHEANKLTGVEFLAYAPLVEGKLEEWEAYAQENQGWIANDWSYRDPTFDFGPISPHVYYAGSKFELDGLGPNEPTEDEDPIGEFAKQ